MNLRRIRTIVIKEFHELARDRKLLMILFIAPILQLIIFGYAANYDITDIPTAVINYDSSQLSQQLVSVITASGYFAVINQNRDHFKAEELLEEGSIWCLLTIPENFSDEIASGRQAKISACFDATNSNSASIAASFLMGAIEQFNQQLARRKMETSVTFAPSQLSIVENEIRIWYNPDLESRNFNVPAVVVQILVVITMVMTSMAIVREREFGTMEQLVVTPISSAELIIGKALPYAFIGMVDVALVCSAAIFYFQVPLIGSLALLFATALIFMLSTMSIGLLISTISATQQQAMISAFFFIMPAILFSGFAFPIENMPDAVQYLTYLNPLRYFVVIIRALFLKGLNFWQLIDQIIPLTLIGIAVLWLAVSRFAKRAG